MKPKKYDFAGWATKYNILCADGRTLLPGAFDDCVQHNNGRVPLVWMHNHNSPEFVVGHADLEPRAEGVYAYLSLNDTKLGKDSRELLSHGDIGSLSIYANKLSQDQSRNVSHGLIREVSIVLAGANPGAMIDFGMAHSAETDPDELAAEIFYPEEDNNLAHYEEEVEETESAKEETPVEETIEHNEESNKEDTAMAEEGKTIKEIFDSMTEEQKQAVYVMVGQAVEDAKNENNNNEEDDDMSNVKHNAFEGDVKNDTLVLTHADEAAIFAEAKKCGSLKEATLAHFDGTDPFEDVIRHSITDVGYLFPDNKMVDREPRVIARKMEWVDAVINFVHKTPFSRIKSIFANITADDARAKGYLAKGTEKIEEVIAMLRRTTDPTTVYKLQKMDRDDVLDITDYDVVAFLKREMRTMLDEEIARAILIGDGRSAVAADKIAEDKIRPIWTDDALFTIKAQIEYDTTDTPETKLNKFIEACVRSRKNYRGSGNPTLFTTEDLVTDLLLLKDVNGRVIYEDEAKLARALRVAKIVTVPVMEGATRVGSSTEAGYDFDLLALIVNPADYNVGADKNGAVTMFDDFDINYNKQEYLIETRCSGALTVPYSAVAVELKKTHVDG